MSKKIYLIEGKRTPFGRFGGSLKDITPVDLAVSCSQAMLKEQGIKPEQIDHFILGNVVPSSTDTMYGGRHLGLKLGGKESTPGYVVNRLCGSGIQVILDAFRLIKLGEAECVLASGTENMSMVPHLTYGGRFGTKYGSLKNVDMLLDALTDQYSKTPMGITAENLAKKYEISRNESDEFSFESHKRAAEAVKNGYLRGEIASIELRKGELSVDEHIRMDASILEMEKLRPSFSKDGVVTPGSASGIVDGAASVIVASENFCQKNGITPIAEIVDGQVIGVDPTIMGIGPVPAISNLLEKQNLKLDDIDLFEINEAFSAQFLACQKELSLDKNKVNIWGGAVAIGHPLGATGVRITNTLARQMRENKSERGIASACIGGGQGISILLKSVN